MFTLNYVRYGEPRYLNNAGIEVDADGGPAVKRQRETVELTLTDLSQDGYPEISATSLGVSELQVLIALLQQKLVRLEHPSVLRDVRREDCKV